MKSTQVKFTPIGNKLRLKKLLAQLQSGSAALKDFGNNIVENHSDIHAKKIEWREATEQEIQSDMHLMKDLVGEV